MNIWLFYPIEKCVEFMKKTDWELRSHVLRIGPVAFLVVWRRKRNDTGKLDDSQAWDCGEEPSDCPYCEKGTGDDL
jgi:hypothetical protein